MTREKIYLRLLRIKSHYELAEYFGILESSIYQWRKNGIPANRIIDIEIFTKGKLSRHQIRPDIFGKRA